MKGDIKKIGLCLSGGGVRAMAFHAGVFRFLIEKDLLKDVTSISSVSGGTLFTGLFMKYSSFDFSNNAKSLATLQYIRKLLTEKSLQKGLVFRLLKFNLFSSRAILLSEEINKMWGIKEKCSDLPIFPRWSINGTTGTTGKRFRVKKDNMGDYTIGYANAADFPLAQAMAISAAFPGGIGPLPISTSKYKFMPKENGAFDEQYKIQLGKDDLQIYDGGVYDNLGIEPYFDCGSSKIKSDVSNDIEFLLVSDASAPFSMEIPGALNPLRFYHLFTILQEQVRALRVRSFMDFVKSSKNGYYVGISEDFEFKRRIYGKKEPVEKTDWFNKAEVEKVASTGTSLTRLEEKVFDAVERQGYESALASYLLRG